jgi:hypothetical protein
VGIKCDQQKKEKKNKKKKKKKKEKEKLKAQKAPTHVCSILTDCLLKKNRGGKSIIFPHLVQFFSYL